MSRQRRRGARLLVNHQIASAASNSAMTSNGKALRFRARRRGRHQRPGGIGCADRAGEGPDIGDIALDIIAGRRRAVSELGAEGHRDLGGLALQGRRGRSRVGDARQCLGAPGALPRGDFAVEGGVDLIRQKRFQRWPVATGKGLEDDLIGRRARLEEMSGLEAGVGQLDVEQGARLGLGWAAPPASAQIGAAGEGGLMRSCGCGS